VTDISRGGMVYDSLTGKHSRHGRNDRAQGNHTATAANDRSSSSRYTAHECSRRDLYDPKTGRSRTTDTTVQGSTHGDAVVERERSWCRRKRWHFDPGKRRLYHNQCRAEGVSINRGVRGDEDGSRPSARLDATATEGESPSPVAPLPSRGTYLASDYPVITSILLSEGEGTGE